MKKSIYNLHVTSTDLSDNITKTEYIGKANIVENMMTYTEKKEPFAQVEIMFDSQKILINRIITNYDLSLNLNLNDKSNAKIITGEGEMIIDIDVFEIVVLDNYIKVDYAIVDGINIVEHFIKEFKYKEAIYE